MQVERGRTDSQELVLPSGERVSNTWVTCLEDWDNGSKGSLIPDNVVVSHDATKKGETRFWMDSRPIS